VRAVGEHQRLTHRLGLTLRPYQAEAIVALGRAWAGERRPTARTRDHAAVNRPACVLPTGAGKTVIFSRMAGQVHADGGRALFLVHRDELAKQTANKLQMAAPGARVGIVKADQNDVDADLLIGSVQTLQNPRRRDQIGQRGLALGIADECHHAASPSWLETLAHFGAFRDMDHPGRVPWAGFTATMTREDKRGLGDVWQEIAYSRTVGQMIDDGYLVPPVGRRIQVEDLDLARVRASRGDLQAGDLGDALMDAGAPRQAAQAVLEHAKDRRTAAFWPTVATAAEFVDECLALGIPAELITGKTPIDQRQDAYRRFQEGTTAVLDTPMVLTEGWDAPWCDCILIGRPTKSKGLFRQMIGRGLRLWPGKTHCLVLDLMGASERHDLAALDDLLESAEEDEEAAERKSTTPDPEAEELDEDTLWTPDGPLRATEVDLFARSHSLWLKTEDRGWWFVPVPGGVFFLYPKADGTYALGHKTAPSGPPAKLLENDLSLEYAMAWAERYAAEADDTYNGPLGFSISTRSAKWRAGNRPPSDAQKGYARSLGIPHTEVETLNKRELSDRISVRIATLALRRVR